MTDDGSSVGRCLPQETIRTYGRYNRRHREHCLTHSSISLRSALRASNKIMSIPLWLIIGITSQAPSPLTRKMTAAQQHLLLFRKDPPRSVNNKFTVWCVYTDGLVHGYPSHTGVRKAVFLHVFWTIDVAEVDHYRASH
jgi:hypothetical protein